MVSSATEISWGTFCPVARCLSIRSSFFSYRNKRPCTIELWVWLWVRLHRLGFQLPDQYCVERSVQPRMHARMTQSAAWAWSTRTLEKRCLGLQSAGITGLKLRLGGWDYSICLCLEARLIVWHPKHIKVWEDIKDSLIVDERKYFHQHFLLRIRYVQYLEVKSQFLQSRDMWFFSS